MSDRKTQTIELSADASNEAVNDFASDETARFWLAALIDSADDAVIGKTLDGVIRSWNKAAERIFGYAAEEVVGKSILTLIPPERRGEEPEIIQKIKRGERIEHYETVRVGKNGAPIDISLSVSPIKNAGGEVIGVSKIVRDISRSKQIEKQLTESEERYRTLFNSIDQGFCLCEVIFDEAGRPADYRFLEVNPLFEKMTGIPNDAAVSGQTVLEIIPNLERKWIEIYGNIALTGESIRFTEQSEVMNRWFDVYGFRVGGEKSRKFALLFNDITANKRAEEKLRESEEHLRYTVELNPQVTWTATPDGNIESFSDRWLGLTGLTREQALGEGWLSIQHPADKDAALAAWTNSIQTGEPYDIEHRIRTAGGNYRWTRSRAYPRFDEANRIIRWHGTTEDIHQHKIADENLRESREMLGLAMSSSLMGAWSRDLATDAVYWSAELEAIFGLPTGTFSGTLGGFRDYVYAEDKQRIADEVQRAIEQKRSYTIEFRFHHADGSLRWMEGRGQAVYAPDGVPKKVYGIGIDITERKREELDREFLLEFGEKIRYGEISREDTLNAVAEMTSRHLEVARCLFIEIDEDENRGTVRHEYCRGDVAPVAGEYKISDYSPQTLDEIKSGRIIVNNDAECDERTAGIYHKVYEPYDERSYVSIPLFTGGRWTAIFWVSDDKPREWTKREIALLGAVGERAWLAAEKLRNEKALEQNRKHLQMAMDAAKIYSWEMNPATLEIEWSNNLERVIGFTLPTDYEITLDDLVHPEDKETLGRQILDAVSGGETYESEFRLVNPQTGQIVWVRGQGVLAEAAPGEAARFVGISQNINERKQAESERENLLRRERDARRQAEEASRLKDEFLATVSHELRTPLNAILGWAQMLNSCGKFSEADTARAIKTIYRNAKSQAQLIEDILDVSRIITGKLRIETEPTTLSPIIQTAIETLRPSIEAKNIKLQTCFDFETKTVLADSNRMLQVFWNLISNAVKFTPDGGRVDIELKTETRQIKIIVSDSGQGIEPEFLPYVFDRFRQADGTSTRAHGGLGLGLSIVRHIVELHGGKVEVFSAGVGAGTAFTIFLPVFDVPDAVEERIGDDLENEVFPLLKKPASEVAASESGGDLEGLRVLLIDDEKDTLEMLSAMLRLSGAQVVPQTNVTDALESIKDWIPQIIISDIGMPEMDGYFFIEKLRNLPPEKGGAIPVIALTAYAGVNEQQRVLASGFQMYLPKPVDSSELLGALTALTKKFD